MIEETNTKEYIIFKRYDKIILLIEETVKVTLITRNKRNSAERA